MLALAPHPSSTQSLRSTCTSSFAYHESTMIYYIFESGTFYNCNLKLWRLCAWIIITSANLWVIKTTGHLWNALSSSSRIHLLCSDERAPCQNQSSMKQHLHFITKNKCSICNMTAVRNRLHQKNKALSKGDPSRTRSMQDIVLKHQQCNGCYMCQVPTPNRRNRIAKQGRPSAESTECQHLIDGFHFLPDDFKFFLVLLAELCNRKAFRIETDKLTSRFSWVLRFEINMFNLPLLLLHVFEAGQHGSQRISKKLLDFDLASQSREKTWLPFGVNRSRKKPDPPPEVQISRRTTWNEKISTSTLHTLQILAMKPPWSCGNSESQSSSCTFDADHSDTRWHDGDIHVTFITRLEEAPLLARVSMSLSEHSFPRMVIRLVS